MKVLFVSSGNTPFGISPITRSQGNSLEKESINLSYFPIEGRGFTSYFHSLFALRKHLQKKHYDVVHAHYSLTAYIATFAGAHPLVVSLMGSDSKKNILSKLAIKLFKELFWDSTIVKSDEMSNSLSIKDVPIIPNGVDIDKFFPQDKSNCQKHLRWENGKTHLLFAAKPSRPEKNFPLAQHMVASLSEDYELHYLMDVDPEDMPTWLNAADVVLLTSLWEGSPNVIKEAMACNRPVVCTDVGDVRWLFGNEPGHFIIPNDISEASIKLEEAVRFSQEFKQTEGKNRIKKLGLDSESVAKQLIEIYNQVK